MLFIPAKEAERLIFQSGISKPGRGGRRKPVRAFTQEGVAMLSSVLRSKRAVTRNIERFPADFMFFLDRDEFAALRCQFGTSKRGPRGGTRYAPMAFTEQGVAMLSSVLRSKRAIQVNVEIMRTFVRLRSLLASHAELSQRLDDLECRYDDQFRCVFDAIRDLMEPPDPPRKRIGFQGE